MVQHTYLTVNTDEMTELRFNGNLADFACAALNEWLEKQNENIRIINIESDFWKDEIRPVMCDSSTWYTRRSMQLSVWYEANGGQAS